METKRKTWELHPLIVDAMMQKKPQHKSQKDFLEDLVVIGLNNWVASLTLPPLQSPHHTPPLNEERIEREREGLNESEANVHKGRERERKENKTKRYKFVVPDSLDWCKGDLMTYWKEAKTGKKTEHAANYLFSELEKIEKEFGQSFVLEQIALATAKGFQSITHANAKRFASNVANPKQKQGDDNSHPSRQVFKASDFYGDQGPSFNPVMQSLING